MYEVVLQNNFDLTFQFLIKFPDKFPSPGLMNLNINGQINMSESESYDGDSVVFTTDSHSTYKTP